LNKREKKNVSVNTNQNQTTKKQKRELATIRLTLLANKAAPSPLLGQMFGQYGVNVMQFCKSFNEQTKNVKDNIYVPTIIKLYSREDYQVIIKSPTTTFLLKQIANIAKGSSMTKKQETGASGEIYLKEIYHIAQIKKCDKRVNHIKIKELSKTIIGSIKSIGIQIKKKNV
jgi:large subunit ribosomal protein L11